MKAINVISKILKYIVIIIVIAMITTLVIPKFIGYTPYTVITGSMEPKYHVGCVTYVKPVAFDELKDGDVITFTTGSLTVTHRIVSVDKENQTVITKGDANNTEDGSISYGNIRGRATIFSIPYLGYAIVWVSTVKGKILLLIILAGLSAASAILKSLASEQK